MMTMGMMVPPSITLAHAALALCLIGPGQAAASPEMAKDKRCMNCHALDRKLVGPALKEVARRYAGQANAVPLLAGKIIQGGAGAWGPMKRAAWPPGS
jgi:cytochrome c